MHLDVTELRDFYNSKMGIAIRRLIRGKIRETWGNVNGLNVFGLGFPVPFLGAFKGEAQRMGALMPAAQGVIMWPAKGPYQSALIEEESLPIPDGSVDRCLIVHSLEMTESAKNLLREVWRILAPEGHIIIIVPNRRGVWARFDSTPFGYGQPFSRGQLQRRLKSAMFSPLNWHNLLYMPPFNLPLLLNSIETWDRVGRFCGPVFSGLLMVEAKKEMYAQVPKGGVKIISGLRPLSTPSLVGVKNRLL